MGHFHMPKLVVIASDKGGSGRTTLAINLTAFTSALAHKALLIDLDPAQDACRWAAEAEPSQMPAGFDPLTQVVSCLEHHDEPGQSPLMDIQQLARLAEADIIIADLPAHTDYRGAALMRAADLVLVPVSASALSLHATSQTLQRLREAQHDGMNIKAMLVPTLEQGQIISPELHSLGYPLAPAITRSAALAHGLASAGSAAAASMSVLTRAVLAGLQVDAPQLQPA